MEQKSLLVSFFSQFFSKHIWLSLWVGISVDNKIHLPLVNAL